MNMQGVVASALFIAMVIGLRRVWLLRKQRPFATLFVLCALNILSAAFLYFSLFPPTRQVRIEYLSILNSNAPWQAHFATEYTPVVALPEANARILAPRTVDIASALRRYPGLKQIHLYGDGLRPRDQDALQGIAMDYIPGPEPKGFIALNSPERVTPGTTWFLSGRTNTDSTDRIELRDPSQRVIARAAPDAQGVFRIVVPESLPGRFLYDLRLISIDKKMRAQLKVPIYSAAEPPLHLLIIAGAANPELKYLRRWASDAHLNLQSSIYLGADLHINPGLLTAQNLSKQDVLIVDDRIWNALSDANRALIDSAVHQGLGVMIRLTEAPNAGAQRRMQALGFRISTVDKTDTVHLTDPAWPALSAQALLVSGQQALHLVRDNSGNALALWRAQGQGRLAVWWLNDSYKLVLNGYAQAHANLWGDALHTLARSHVLIMPHQSNRLAWVNERITFCNLDTSTIVRNPDDSQQTLVLSGPQLCAGFWPTQAGWHTLQWHQNAWPFYVRANNEAPTLQEASRRTATMRSMGTIPDRKNLAQITQPGSPWRYFLAWLCCTAILWLIERRFWNTRAPKEPAQHA